LENHLSFVSSSIHGPDCIGGNQKPESRKRKTKKRNKTGFTPMHMQNKSRAAPQMVKLKSDSDNNKNIYTPGLLGLFLCFSDMLLHSESCGQNTAMLQIL
jgi:hypothetical protein